MTMSFRFSLVQALASLALLTTSAFGSAQQSALKVFICPSDSIRISSDGVTEVARFRMTLNFQPSDSRSPGRSGHPGGANFLFADGSVRLLEATDARLVFDSKGNVVEIQAEMMDARSGGTLFFHILPHVEQDNLYHFTVIEDETRYEYDALGHLLPAVPTSGLAADRCLAAAGDVFRPDGPERFGHLHGDAASVDGIWGLRFSATDLRTYFANDAPVLADFMSDGVLTLGFPMEEVRFDSDRGRQVSSVQAMVEVAIDDLRAAGRSAARPVCMSLLRDGNVFAVWLTVGFFEVMDEATDTPRLRSFAIVDRTQL